MSSVHWYTLIADEEIFWVIIGQRSPYQDLASKPTKRPS